METEDLRALLDSWLLRLRAERKAAPTLRSYRAGVALYLEFCTAAGLSPDLKPDSVAAYTNEQLERGLAPASARLRQLSVRLFSRWLAEEGEIGRDELLGLRPPKLNETPVDGLSEEQVDALIRACRGKRLEDRRDEALVRLMVETGLRAGEAIALTTDDIDLARGLATVWNGKGGKARVVAFGPLTGATVDRYLRMRKGHPRAELPDLWLGGRGQRYRYDALYLSLRRRATLAGIEGFHPHQLRHSFASRWLTAGGSEGGLKSMAGWARRDQIDRYTADTAQKRAHDESRRLNIGPS